MLLLHFARGVPGSHVLFVFSASLTAQEKQAQPAASKPRSEQDVGIVAMINKDNSSIMVQKGNNKHQIFYDANTKITSGKKIVSFDNLKEGSRVACPVDAKDKAGPMACAYTSGPGESSLGATVTSLRSKSHDPALAGAGGAASRLRAAPAGSSRH